MDINERIQDKRHAKDPNNFKYAKLKIYAPEKSDLHEITLTCIKALDHNGAWNFDIQSIDDENTNIVTFKYNGTIAALDAVQKLHFNGEHTIKFEWDDMKQTYHIGECPVCRKYGRMELYYDLSSGKISAICEECELEFDSIDDYKKAVNGHRDLCCSNTDTMPLVRPASLEEIKRSEWYPFVTDK